jgi:hypothetical protein
MSKIQNDINSKIADIQTKEYSLSDLRAIKRNFCGYKGNYRETRETLQAAVKSAETDEAKAAAKADLAELKAAFAQLRTVVNGAIATKKNQKESSIKNRKADRLAKINDRIAKLEDERNELLASLNGSIEDSDSDEIDEPVEVDSIDPDFGFDFESGESEL